MLMATTEMGRRLKNAGDADTMPTGHRHTDTKGNAIINIFTRGGFQGWPLIDNYLFHFSVHYSGFGS